MNLVRFQQPGMFYSVNSLLNDLLKDRTYTSARSSDHYYPAVNIAENDTAFELEFLVPGFEKENFTISNKKDVLTVKGSIPEKETQQEQYTCKRFSIQNFERSFNLPEGVNTEEISARYHNGILTVNIPKKVNEIHQVELNIPVH